jgi:hypothetical protein
MQRFQAKVVIVTGAASGIREATARCFSSEGACVALVDRNEIPLGQSRFGSAGRSHPRANCRCIGQRCSQGDGGNGREAFRRTGRPGQQCRRVRWWRPDERWRKAMAPTASSMAAAPRCLTSRFLPMFSAKRPNIRPECRARLLVSRPAQSRFQLLFLLLPTCLFGLRPFSTAARSASMVPALLSWSRFAFSSAACALAIACCCLSRSFSLAVSSFRRSLSRCLCSLSKASAALRAALLSLDRGTCFFGFARAFARLCLGSSPDRCVGRSA